MMKMTALLLRYDPELRMTSAQCLDHPFTVEEVFKPLRLSVTDLTAKVVKLGPFPLGYGGYGEVWRGKLLKDDGSIQDASYYTVMECFFLMNSLQVAMHDGILEGMQVTHSLSDISDLREQSGEHILERT